MSHEPAANGPHREPCDLDVPPDIYPDRHPDRPFEIAVFEDDDEDEWPDEFTGCESRPTVHSPAAFFDGRYASLRTVRREP